MAPSESATRTPAVAVVTDSAACIPSQLVEALRIGIARHVLLIDGEVIPDGGLPTDEFHRRLLGSTSPPTTAGVPPAAFAEAFRAAAAKHVICITVSSKFSSTYANALLAAREVGREGVEVRVVDSGYATMAQGFVALAAARAAYEGATADEAETAARAVIEEVGLVMMLEDLDHLARGGRVPRVAAWATTLLQLRPLVEFRHREIKLAGRARTRPGGLRSLLDLLESRVGAAVRLHLAVHHADAAGDAEWLAEEAQRRFKPASLVTTEFTQVMTAHVGPGLVGFAYWRES
jgi:DegV family protein with EDD domain